MLRNSKNNSYMFIVYLVLINLFLFLSAGCSGSGSKSTGSTGNTSASKNISGVVQKGIYINGSMSVQYIDENGSLVGKEIVSKIDSDGKYQLGLTKKGLVLLTAVGHFIDENTNKTSSEEATLYALVNIDKEKFSKESNINLFTSLEAQRILTLLKEGKDYEEAYTMAKSSMKTSLSLAQDVKSENLDLYDIKGTQKEANKNLLLFSATFLSAVENRINKPSRKIEKFTFSKLSSMFDDFKDDGLFNGDSKPIWDAMRESNRSAVWSGAVANLDLDVQQPGDVTWQVPDGDFHTFPDGGLVSIITLKLKSVSLDARVTPYTDQDAIYVGSNTGDSNLTFKLRSQILNNNHFDIYLVILGESDFLVKSNVALVSSQATFSVTLTSSIRTRLQDAYDQGKTVIFRAIATTGSTSVSTSDLPIFGEISTSMTPNTTVTTASYRSACTGVFADINHAKVDILGTLHGVDVTYNNVCVLLTYNASSKSYDTTLVKGSGNLDDDIHTHIGGLDVYIDTSSVDKDNMNINTITLVLPKGHGIHPLLPSSFVSMRGDRNITLINPVSNVISHEQDLSTMTFQGTFVDKFLHAKNLPFYLKLSGYELSNIGISFEDTTPDYVFRGVNRHTNNSERFYKPDAGQKVNVLLTKTGLTTTYPGGILIGTNNFKFDGGDPLKMQYPLMTVKTDTFNIELNNSKIVPIITNTDEFASLTYDKNCRLMNCGDTGINTSLELKDFVSTALYSDGSTVSMKDDKIGIVSWGYKQGSHTVYERGADVGAYLYIPGFELPTSNPSDISEFLLGTVQEKSNGIIHRTRLSNSSKKGRYLFAGINVGKLVIDGSDNSAAKGISLSGAGMTLALGENASANQILESNSYTKYYIRPSGITGVFNRRPDAFSQNIYGYDMEFSQFSFRQVANKIDTYTLIDGEVVVPGKGNFQVAFNSLGLDCRGGLNKGSVVLCDGAGGPNCGATLGAWNMNTTFTTVAFEGDSDVCSSTKQLAVGHVLDVMALKDKLGLKAIWKSNGSPKNAVVTSSAYNQLDGNISKNSAISNDGYDIAFGDDIALRSLGSRDWLQADVDLGLPFWEKAEMILRLTNSTVTQKETSVVIKQGDISQVDMTKTNHAIAQDIIRDYRFDAEYHWANGLVNFKLPVYYNANNDQHTTPKFLGRSLSADLKVVELKAGIDYISPSSTSMSFGASADFEAMGNLKLHIDLNDPDSIRDIDSALDTYVGIGGQPLTNTIGVVVENLRIGNKLLGEGTSLAMEELAIMALEEGSNALGSADPFEEIAQIISKVHALPAVLNDRAKESIQDAIITPIDKVFKDIDTMISDADLGLSQNYNTFATANDATIQSILNTLNLVDQGINHYEDLRGVLNDIKSGLNTVNQVTNIITDVNDTIRRYFKPDTGNCSWSYTTNQDFFKPIGQIDKVIQDVNTNLQNIQIDKITTLAQQINNYTGLDSADLVALAEKIRELSISLNDLVNSKTGAFHVQFKTHICDNLDVIMTQMMEVVSRANQVIAIKDEIVTLINALETPLKPGGKIGSIVYGLKAFIPKIRHELTNMYTNVSVTVVADTANIIVRGALLSMQEENSTNPLVTNLTPTTADALNLLQINLTNTINTELQALIFDKTDLLVQKLQDEIPNISASDMRRILVTKLFETEPMQELNEQFVAMLQPIADEVNKVAMSLLSGIDRSVNKVLAAVSDEVNKVLSKATAQLKNNMPVKAAKIDGYAIIHGDRLAQAHIGSEFEIKGDSKDTSFSLNAALDIWNDDANDSTGCNAAGTSGNLNIQISTRDISMPLGDQTLKVDLVLLGVTIDSSGLPVGIFGAISSKSGFDFDTVKLYNLGLATGIGVSETYLAAKASGKIDSVQLGVSFMIGRICNKEVINTFIPESLEGFITIPKVFKGALVYGEAQIPVWDNGCALRLTVRAKVGVWYLLGLTAAENDGISGTSDTFGGLIGGGAFGKGLCIATLGGEITVMAEKTGDNVRFQGSGWGAAGLGSCDDSWSSVRKSRKDDWCGTGDAQFAARYDNGWTVLDLSTSAIH